MREVYNVVDDYDWTSAPKGSGIRKNAPKVWLKSHKIKSNQIMQVIQGYIALVKGGIGKGGNADAFYDNLYSGSVEPEDNFYFPYFSNGIRSFSNTFGDTFQNGVGGSGGILSNINEQVKEVVGGLAQMGTIATNIAQNGSAPGTYVESPLFYQFDKNDAPLEVSFILANTISSDSVTNNQKLVKKLTMINKPMRQDSISVDPPRIYQVKVAGQRFIRWAYCSQFGVDLIGTKREINGKLVPEGYQISMSFQSLTMEHAGFMDKI